MLRRNPSLIVALAVTLLASLALAACPARRSGSPADLEPAFLDRA